MKRFVLNASERAQTGFTHKFNITYSDLVTAAASGGVTNVTLQLFPSGTGTAAVGTTVEKAAFRLVTAFDFSDSGITSLLMEVGDGGDTDRFIPQKEVAVDGTEILWFETSQATGTLPYSYLTADGIDVKFTAANGGSPTIDETTSGEVDIYLRITELQGFVRPKGDSGT
jgi:hypothetical protein